MSRSTRPLKMSEAFKLVKTVGAIVTPAGKHLKMLRAGSTRGRERPGARPELAAVEDLSMNLWGVFCR